MKTKEGCDGECLTSDCKDGCHLDGPPENCGTCKKRAGTRCNKTKKYIELGDWCSAYKPTGT